MGFRPERVGGFKGFRVEGYKVTVASSPYI